MRPVTEQSSDSGSSFFFIKLKMPLSALRTVRRISQIHRTVLYVNFSSFPYVSPATPFHEIAFAKADQVVKPPQYCGSKFDCTVATCW